MNNEDLIRNFESAAIPADSFHHADHVRLAFAYLSQYPPLQALEKFCTALRRYADAHGKSRLYHETITHAYFFVIRERMVRGSAQFSSNDSPSTDRTSNDRPSNDWNDFARRNPDLFVWKNGILTRYYTEATLQSELARSVFLFPDKF